MNELWTAAEHPVVPNDKAACTRCGSALHLMGPRPDGFSPETGRALFSWELRCPSRLAVFLGHDAYRLIPRRALIGRSFDRYSGPRPIYAEIGEADSVDPFRNDRYALTHRRMRVEAHRADSVRTL